jgi:hypothetical protein
MEHKDWQPTRKAYSRAEAEAFAKAYLLDLYGPPKEMSEEARDRHYTRLGLIVGMFADMFPNP